MTPITDEDRKSAQKRLEKTYKFIPSEKKTYLCNLMDSQGPWLAVENTSHFILDAASQITSLGLGFNPGSLFGTAHHIEAWLNLETREIKSIRKSFDAFLARKLKTSQVFTSFCHSGAEANEIALSYCFESRNNPAARKILAFEGSFHGRMLLSLSCTWNPQKREPFERPEILVDYIPYPSLKGDMIQQKIPSDWIYEWGLSIKDNWTPPSSWNYDSQIKKEIDSLLSIRDCLITGEIFAIIIEPMQCEGGENYSSGRFHSGLLTLAKVFDVPVIYDEVQTGFHLGREFFWHRQWDIPLRPAFITCAKRSQIGLLISFTPFNDKKMEYNVASFLRGMIQAHVLDQQQDHIKKLEAWAKERLNNLVNTYKDFLLRPRSMGTAFAFTCKNKEMTDQLVARRFHYGIMFYPAGEDTLRFRLNLSYTQKELDFLFETLHCLIKSVIQKKDIPPPKLPVERKHTHKLFEWHAFFLKNRLSLLLNKNLSTSHPKMTSLLGNDFLLETLDEKRFIQIKKDMEKLQKDTYESIRQTSLDYFKKAVCNPHGVCLALLHKKNLAAIAFASPLKDHPLERGVRRDPWFNDPSCLYAMDVTVDKKYQGQGLGTFLKQVLFFHAQKKGHKRINGRNRDRMAAKMWNINLSLGSWELFHLEEDYLDSKPYRDALYYTCKLHWESPPLNLSSAIASPLGTGDLSSNFLDKGLPFVVNKTTLSNFVNTPFLEMIENIFSLFPNPLQQGHTASGQSECADKIAKSLWYNGNKKTTFISFKGHFFGNGGLFSKSLSGDSSFFSVIHLPHPRNENKKEVLSLLKKILEKNNISSIWMEPLPQKLLEKVPRDFLVQMKTLCTQKKIPIVYNETASSVYRYGKNFYCGFDEKTTPDAMMVYLGGQSGVVGIKKDYYVDKPLMMISTWDGDLLSFFCFTTLVEKIKKDTSAYFKIKERFNKKLLCELKGLPVQVFIENGVGYIKGTLPPFLERLFEKTVDRYLVCPSYNNMETFVE